MATLDGTSSAGFNRVWWDFTGEGPTEIRLRTKPLYSDWFPMPDEGYRVGGGGFGGGGGPLQPPGTYTVTLLVDDEEMGSQPLNVLKDPNSEGHDGGHRAARPSWCRRSWPTATGPRTW